VNGFGPAHIEKSHFKGIFGENICSIVSEPVVSF
jgi:hypothetical protein